MAERSNVLFPGALETDRSTWKKYHQLRFTIGDNSRYRAELERKRARYPKAFDAFYYEAFVAVRQNSLLVEPLLQRSKNAIRSEVCSRFQLPETVVSDCFQFPSGLCLLTFKPNRLDPCQLNQIRTFVQNGERLPSSKCRLTNATNPSRHAVYFYFADQVGEKTYSNSEWNQKNETVDDACLSLNGSSCSRASSSSSSSSRSSSSSSSRSSGTPSTIELPWYPQSTSLSLSLSVSIDESALPKRLSDGAPTHPTQTDWVYERFNDIVLCAKRQNRDEVHVMTNLGLTEQDPTPPKTLESAIIHTPIATLEPTIFIHRRFDVSMRMLAPSSDPGLYLKLVELMIEAKRLGLSAASVSLDSVVRTCGQWTLHAVPHAHGVQTMPRLAELFRELASSLNDLWRPYLDDVIHAMTSRPNVTLDNVRHHPFFLTIDPSLDENQKKARITKYALTPPSYTIDPQRVPNWMTSLYNKGYVTTKTHASYQNNVTDAIRFVRNCAHHPKDEIAALCKARIAADYDSVCEFLFLSPELKWVLLELWKARCDHVHARRMAHAASDERLQAEIARLERMRAEAHTALEHSIKACV